MTCPVCKGWGLNADGIALDGAAWALISGLQLKAQRSGSQTMMQIATRIAGAPPDPILGYSATGHSYNAAEWLLKHAGGGLTFAALQCPQCGGEGDIPAPADVPEFVSE